jgi:hypothetical protein
MNAIQFEHGRLYLNLFLNGDTTNIRDGGVSKLVSSAISACVEFILSDPNSNGAGSFFARF